MNTIQDNQTLKAIQTGTFCVQWKSCNEGWGCRLATKTLFPGARTKWIAFDM